MQEVILYMHIVLRFSDHFKMCVFYTLYLSIPFRTVYIHLYSKLSDSTSFKEQLKQSKELFQQLDTDVDGKVNLNEFASLMRDSRGRPSWLFKAAALADQSGHGNW